VVRTFSRSDGDILGRVWKELTDAVDGPIFEKGKSQVLEEIIDYVQTPVEVATTTPVLVLVQVPPTGGSRL
jgi:hypothetical protein